MIKVLQTYQSWYDNRKFKQIQRKFKYFKNIKIEQPRNISAPFISSTDIDVKRKHLSHNVHPIVINRRKIIAIKVSTQNILLLTYQSILVSKSALKLFQYIQF